MAINRRPGERRPVKTVWMLLLAGLLVLQAGSLYAADTTHVLIVLSADAEPYHQAESSLKSKLNSSNFTSNSIQLTDLAKDFPEKSKNIDFFAAIGTKAALWLHQKAESPARVVYCMVSDPENLGLSGDNKCYGVSTDVPLSDQFNLIREAMPSVTIIGMLYHSNTDKGKGVLEKVKSSLPKGCQLNAVAINQYDSVAKAIESLLQNKTDIVWTSPDASVYDVATTRTLLLSAVRSDTPVFGFSPAFVRAGALLGVGIEPETQGRQAAELIIDLNNKKTLDSPIRSPEFKIAVNLIVADKLSVNLSKTLVDRSEYVFRAKN